jgi:hypothetical protein
MLGHDRAHLSSVMIEQGGKQCDSSRHNNDAGASNDWI